MYIGAKSYKKKGLSVIIIPARYGSTRLKGKALKTIGDRCMIYHVAQACLKSTTARVIVATDSEEIGRAAGPGVEIVMTGEHEAGTDRVYEAATKLNVPDDEIIINVQGDYPFISPDDIAKLGNHKEVKRGAMATLYKKDYGSGKGDPNIVKVVIDNRGRALYFSRSPIPHPPGLQCFFEHVGMYAFQMSTLRQFCETPRGDIERLENIEHLRALVQGIDIYMIETKFDYIGVNTEADLKKARERV